MGFFAGLSLEDVRTLTKIQDNNFSLTVAALRIVKIANGVSKMHAKVSTDMLRVYGDICEIIL